LARWQLMKTSTLVRILGLGLLIAALAAGWLFLPAEKITELLHWVQRQGAWGPLLLGAAYVVACVLFVPGIILTLGAGFLFGPVLGTVTVSIASVLGATAAFLVGRYLARGWIERKVRAYPKFRAIDRAVAREGFKIVLLVRLSPVFPFNLLNYAFGLTRVSLRDYVLASWIGMLPATVVYVYLGSAAKSLTGLFDEQIQGGLGSQVLYAVGLLAAIVVAVFVARIAQRALREAIPEAETGQPPSTAEKANA
jgi:uncharacterized membrane protein YdjX (TVP38/TMEM64 family)